MTATFVDLPSTTGFPGNADAGSRPWLPPIFRDAVKFEPSALQGGQEPPALHQPSTTTLLPLSHQGSYLGFARSNRNNKLPAASMSSASHKRAEQHFPDILPALPSTGLKSMETIIAAQQAAPGSVPSEHSSSIAMQRFESPEDWIELMYHTSHYNRERLPDAEDSRLDPKDTPCTVLLKMPPPKTGSSGVPVVRNNSKRQLSPISQNAGAPGKSGNGRRSKARVSLPGPRGSGLPPRQQPKW